MPLIEQVRPAIYVKGGDYREEDLPEAPVVRGYGGDVRILSLVAGRSTTNIIARSLRRLRPGRQATLTGAT